MNKFHYSIRKKEKKQKEKKQYLRIVAAKKVLATKDFCQSYDFLFVSICRI